MNYSIFGDSDCPIVQASLKRGETIKVERGFHGVYFQCRIGR